MPSSRSPSVRSWYSASALSTLSRRFSMRTPVCTRSICVMVYMYQNNTRLSKDHDLPCILSLRRRSQKGSLRFSTDADVRIEGDDRGASKPDLGGDRRCRALVRVDPDGRPH